MEAQDLLEDREFQDKIKKTSLKRGREYKKDKTGSSQMATGFGVLFECLGIGSINDFIRQKLKDRASNPF